MRILSGLFRFLKRAARLVLPAKYYEKLRSWYLHRRETRNRREFLKERSAFDLSKYKTLPFGVNLFIYCANNSAGVEGHLLQQALEAAEIPYNLIDLYKPEEFNAEVKNKTLYSINLIVCHAASGASQRMRMLDIDLNRHFNICYWAWELPEVPDIFMEGLDIFQEFWTMSAFCTRALEKKALVPVLTVPLYANPDRKVIENGRDYFKIDKDVFLFMFAYDCNSYVSRKNPQAMVQAFLKAFSPEDRDVGLVLKLVFSERSKEHVEELKETLSPYKNIYFVEKYLSDDEMRTLIYLSDAFVSLHRAEGFGLLPLEAMSLGVPVISTEWSGNMEYMNHSNTALVGYELVPVAGEYVGLGPEDDVVWADPDVDEAALYMRRMVSDKVWREKLIASGRHTADNCYTASAIGKLMYNRLKYLTLTQSSEVK